MSDYEDKSEGELEEYESPAKGEPVPRPAAPEQLVSSDEEDAGAASEPSSEESSDANSDTEDERALSPLHRALRAHACAWAQPGAVPV